MRNDDVAAYDSSRFDGGAISVEVLLNSHKKAMLKELLLHIIEYLIFADQPFVGS